MALVQNDLDKGAWSSRIRCGNEGIRRAGKNRWPFGKFWVRQLTFQFMPLCQLSIAAVCVMRLLGCREQEHP